ncbi:hypothetical protein HNY73_009759 [Argiope bruennichi]|uniref:Peptidase aspartic putative domain-containing protein n=1 Tax=Argiope bruennichi TaxID=94029 RepID=A0A8T0FFL2_ARGBR|nr:hypothetical protein HNY73_009759 [Argiope bruennichi]
MLLTTLNCQRGAFKTKINKTETFIKKFEPSDDSKKDTIQLDTKLTSVNDILRGLNEIKCELGALPDDVDLKDAPELTIELCQDSLVTKASTLLLTILVKILNKNRSLIIRGLFDTGAQRSFIKKDIVDKLGLEPIDQEMLSHGLWGGSETKEKFHNVYNNTLQSLCSNFRRNISVLYEKNICGAIPRVSNPEIFLILKRKNIELSDTGEDTPEIDLLIGAIPVPSPQKDKDTNTQLPATSDQNSSEDDDYITKVTPDVVTKAGRRIKIPNRLVAISDHMEKVLNFDEIKSDDGLFLPHYGVLRSGNRARPIRVVFNGSQKTNLIISLNDVLCKETHLFSRGLNAPALVKNELWWKGPDPTKLVLAEHSRNCTDDIKKEFKTSVTKTLLLSTEIDLFHKIVSVTNKFCKLIRILSYIFIFIKYVN